MAHTSATSMRAFTKGRCAFDSDEEYQAALRGELDDLGVHEDFGYESGSPEDPDDGEGPDTEGPWEGESSEGDDYGSSEDLTDEEAVKAELEDFEDRIGGTHFLEVLEKFMQRCSGCGEPPYLPFRPVQGVEHLALFCHGSEALRLRYGAYGFEADRLEGDEVVKTWKGLDETDLLNDWDDALAELAEDAEIEKEDFEDGQKDEFFDALPGVLADRKRGAAFIDFVTSASPVFAYEKDGAAPGETCLPFSERFWLAWDGAECEFRLKGHPGEARVLATWDKEEFLEKLREVAWDDADARKLMLGGGLEKAWGALDDAWYDEDEDDLVVNSVGKFLAVVEGAKKGPWVGRVKKDVAVCDELDTGRMEMKMTWDKTCPDVAELTFTRNGKKETFNGIPLTFLRWWAFGRGERSW